MSKQIDPAEYTGKTRAQRIRLDYHKHRSAIYRWRWIATAIAIVLCGAYLAWVSIVPAGKTHLSTGAVSTAHHGFEQDCASCHADFVPTASDAWQIDPSTAIKTTANKCLSCHQNTGAHTQSLNDLGQLTDQRCALCHGEHLGRNHDLIPTSNQTCVACHEKTSDFCNTDASSSPPANVSQFSLASHGDFASLRSPVMDSENSPRIEFDHALHMNPGQVIPGRRGAMTLARLPESWVEKYKMPGQSMGEFVQLQCADCHDFQSSASGLQRSGEYGWGTNSSPITYNQHCIACHPLTVPGQREGQWAIPHGVAISSLRDAVAGQAAANAHVSDITSGFWKTDSFPIHIPGSGASLPSTREPSGDATVDDTSRVQGASLYKERIAQQCRVCHINTDLETTRSIPRIPSPRLRAGRFDHSAHRGVTCVACHPQADPSGNSISNPERLAILKWLDNINSAAMIVGIESCTPCHRDSSQPDTASETSSAFKPLLGGLSDRAPDRCTTCHEYHSDRGSVEDQEPNFVRELSLINTQATLPSTLTNFQNNSGLSDLKPSGGRWVGSDSCGTSTCHSGPIGTQPNWNSSQSVFEAFDPHAKAGLTLSSQWSRQIVLALDPESKDSHDRFQQVLRSRCNSCHSPIDAKGVMLGDVMSSGLSMESEAGVKSHQEHGLAGVSCEACHGPASDWVQSHLREDWSVSDSMRETRNFVQRIEGCVRCHVGSRRADGLVRDMNHDMIAAGHPALRFDGWSALTRLPRHAPEDRERDGLPNLADESDLRRFLAAQAIAIRTAIQLSADRRIDSKSTAADALSTDSVWPELADFDCFACHHNLSITNFAARPSYGHPLPHPSLLAGFVDYGLKYLGASDVDAMNKALETIRLRAAGINQIKPAAFQIDGIISRYLARLADPRPLPQEMKSIAAWSSPETLQSNANNNANASVTGDWYRASHWYLRSHAVIRDRQVQSDRRQVAANLRAMADLLQFRRRSDQQNAWTVDSPESFDMSVYRELSKRLSDSVETK